MIKIKSITILGSTGSIGVQTLDVIKNLEYKVIALSADKNIDLLEKQIIEHMPKVAVVNDNLKAAELKRRLKSGATTILSGQKGLVTIATMEEADIIVAAIVGIAGLIPTYEAVKKGKVVAIANKETLVTAGQIIMKEAKNKRAVILPIDSEHSAIFQCLEGNNKKELHKIILTASGGPFRGLNYKHFKNITPKKALKHPNWKMGSKISIDSATMMNKGLEVIEAKWLFDLRLEQIEIIIHPQSIIHSMVEYIDGSVIAQLGEPDMRIPIQYAITYPKRYTNKFNRLNILKIGKLTFEKPDYFAFPCLGLAFEAIKEGGTMPTVLNSANEEAVKLFLEEKIKFTMIPIFIEKAMNKHINIPNPNICDIISTDKWVRDIINEMI